MVQLIDSHICKIHWDCNSILFAWFGSALPVYVIRVLLTQEEGEVLSVPPVALKKTLLGTATE